jgi:hypothetical protein
MLLIKNRYFIMLISVCTAILTMSLQKCYRDDIPEPKPVYDFAEKIILSPYKKTYAITDTIWLQFKTTDKKLFDKISNSRVSTDTTHLYMHFNYSKLYPFYNVANSELCSVVFTGNLNYSSFTRPEFYNVIEVDTDCNSNFYFIKIGIVPKNTGIFLISIGASVRNCPNKKVHSYIKTSFTFDLADCNKDVFLSIPASSRGAGQDLTELQLDNKELFAFKVE